MPYEEEDTFAGRQKPLPSIHCAHSNAGPWAQQKKKKHKNINAKSRYCPCSVDIRTQGHGTALLVIISMKYY